MDIGKTFGPDIASTWEPSVVQQFTRDGTLWAVPQLTDAGIALYYNADLLAAAGVDPAALTTLRWSPGGDDTLRPLLARLTVDVDGHSAGTPGFDPDRIRQWAYNAANDAQGIYLNYIGSAGGVFQDGDRFAFDNPAAVEAFTYLVEADQPTTTLHRPLRTPTRTATSPATSSWPARWRCFNPAPTTWPQSPGKPTSTGA